MWYEELVTAVAQYIHERAGLPALKQLLSREQIYNAPFKKAICTMKH